MLAVKPSDLQRFMAICERERCPYAVVGEATEEKKITVIDEHFDNSPVDLPMSVLFGKTPKMHRHAARQEMQHDEFSSQGIDLTEAVFRVLRHPTVASKGFLITIGSTL